MLATKDHHCLAVALAVALASSAPVMACVPYLPPLNLPDETPEAFDLRTRSLLAARYDEERRSWQQGRFEQAERVLLARVTSIRSTAGDHLPLVTAQALLAIKGELPAAPLDVRDRRGQSCAPTVGGQRRSARVGDHIILFDATRLNPDAPSVTMEIPLHEARDPRLIDAIYAAPRQLMNQAKP